MALAATTLWEVQTGGSDTLNGGAFDPGQTAGMFTDGAATVATSGAPVFTSASYNFVAGDVGAWLYIASGTNWTAGWYQIASVAANAATLSAALGSGVVAGNAGMTTVAGCATTASPTGATWSIDYSQQAAAQFTYLDLASAGTGLTVSSTAFPFAKQHVGNAIVITGGTNFNTGRYIIASVAAGVATVKGPTNITTGAGASGTGGQGGALASPGQLSALISSTAGSVSTNAFIKAGTYTILSASTNIATGCLALPAADGRLVGYSTHRTVVNTDTQPILIFNAGLSTATFFATTGRQRIDNLTLDGNSQTTSKLVSAGTLHFSRCTLKNFTAASSVNGEWEECYVTGCSAAPIAGPAIHCVATANTATPFTVGPFFGCISYANTGATTDGFNLTVPAQCVHCIAYGNGRDGFGPSTQVSAHPAAYVNCIAEANTGYGYSGSTAGFSHLWRNCASYNNTAGLIRTTTETGIQLPAILVGSGSFFTSAASGDFSLNNTAGAGALLRAAGFPGLLPGGLTTGSQDIGAAQHADPTAIKYPIFQSPIVEAIEVSA